MHSVIPLLATLPPGFLWAIVVLVTLAFPLVPFFVVRALQISDERKQEIQERVASLPETGAIDEVVLLTVEDWPSMDEVVYEDASTGPTPVGFEFKADTVAGDVESALKSRGIQVRTMDIREVESIEQLDQPDLFAVVYPARHEQLPWQLLAFFDEVVEPRVASYEPALNKVPLAALALGDKPEDIASSQKHMQQLGQRYKLSILTNAGLIDTPDRLALYDETLGFAESLLRLPNNGSEYP